MEKEKVIKCLQKAKIVIETWIPMFEQYNTPAGIDAAIALLKEQEGIIKNLDDKNTTLMLLINEYLEKEREAEAVVRCKDCKYCEYPDCEYPEAEKGLCKKGHIHRNAETWFCADGERKTDDA